MGATSSLDPVDEALRLFAATLSALLDALLDAMARFCVAIQRLEGIVALRRTAFYLRLRAWLPDGPARWIARRWPERWL